MPASLRPRLLYLVLAAATIVIGLAVHFHGGFLGPVARDVLGDALWAMMIVWWTGVFAPAARIPVRGAAALATCFAVELGQLVRLPALDALRHTVPGHLVLGSGFDPRDLFAYTAGVVAAVLLERAVRTRSRTSPGAHRPATS